MGCLLFLLLFRVHCIREPVHAERNVLPRRRQAITPPTSWLHRIFVDRQVQTSYAYGLANHRQRRSYSIIRTIRWRVRPASYIFSQLTPLANNYFIFSHPYLYSPWSPQIQHPRHLLDKHRPRRISRPIHPFLHIQNSQLPQYQSRSEIVHLFIRVEDHRS